jgi:hypothetical protein
MSRHTAYAVAPSGRVSRHPFASFPHADAARRWVAAHPDMPVRFVPALPAAACPPEDGHYVPGDDYVCEVCGAAWVLFETDDPTMDEWRMVLAPGKAHQ